MNEINYFLKKNQQLLNEDVKRFIIKAENKLSIKDFNTLIDMLNACNIDGVEEGLDFLLESSLEFYVGYILSMEEKKDILIDEFVEKVMIPQTTYMSKTSDELIEWIIKNKELIGVKITSTPNGTYISEK